MRKLKKHILMNRYYLLLLFLLITRFSFCQDIISTKDGKIIESKVLRIDIDVVIYKNFNNLNGPEYTISKKDIIKIEYENGVSEIFKRVKKEYKKDPELDKYKVEPRDEKFILWEYQFNIQEVISSPSIYYYGLDMSNLILVNGEKAYQDQELRHYIPAWVAKFEEEKVSKPMKLAKKFEKDNIQLVQNQIQNEERYNLVDEDWIRPNSRDIPIEQVKDIVESLKNNISEKEGVGFIMIMDSFNKPENRVRGICTFFNISTGELLWAAKVKSAAGDKGMTRHWGFGIVRMFNIYFIDVYNPQQRRLKD